MERMRENCNVLGSELLAVKKECSLMELEFKQKYEIDAVEARNYKDFRGLLTAARADIDRRKQENSRLKQQADILKSELEKAKEELSQFRKAHEMCVIVKPENEESASKKDSTVKTEEETRTLEEVLTSEKKLMTELEKFRQIYRGADADRLKRQLNRLHDDNERLKKEINSYIQSEKGLMSEMENTTLAVEDLMNQNTTLAARIAEQEETYIKMVKDGLQNEASARILKQSIETLEEKVRTVENEREAVKIECHQWTEKAELCSNNAATLESNVRKLNTALEQLRQKANNMNVELSELKIRYEKQTVEVQDLRQQLKEKTSSVEGSRTKVTRLREERNVLRKKLSRAKQAADCQNFDELLMAENKMLRESLSCPSCKTNDKNTVLTKCFHVFCSDCIKKRYDGRSRKCPKCNAAFGANDFHRIYLE